MKLFTKYIRVAFLVVAYAALVVKANGDNANTIHKVSASIDAIFQNPVLRNGFQGAQVVSAKDGKLLYSRLETHVFLPASNNKLLTGSAALGILGPKFTYVTNVYATGQIVSGELHGELLIRGSGDPTLDLDALRQMASKIAGTGLRQIHGSLEYDASLFDDQGLGEAWEWDDEPYYYAAQISALNVDRNVANIIVIAGGSEGDPVQVQSNPAFTGVFTIQNTATTTPADGKPHITLTRLRGSNTLTVTGTIPPGMTATPIRVTFEDPARVTAIVFKSLLEHEGVVFDELKVSRYVGSTAGLVPVTSHESSNLGTILGLMNKPSDNMIAECLLKTVGAIKRGKGTAGASGTGCVCAAEWLQSIGLQRSELHQVDGSGLSRQNYVSPANLVRLLRFWALSPNFKIMYDSLPIAGVDGTLKSRMKGTRAENNCHAKTGSVGQVSSLSGYVTTRDGVLLIFSILTNNQIGSVRPCMDAQNRLVTLLSELEFNTISSPNAVKSSQLKGSRKYGL